MWNIQRAVDMIYVGEIWFINHRMTKRYSLAANELLQHQERPPQARVYQQRVERVTYNLLYEI